MHISRIQNDDKAYTNKNSEDWSAAEQADIAARCANRNITWTEAYFPPKTCKRPPNDTQYATIQAKQVKLYPDIPSHKQTTLGTVEVEGIMTKIKEYVYKLCKYVLAMKIALEQPRLVADGNLLYIAQSIIECSTFILDRYDLSNYIHITLQYVAPTIGKSYSRHIANFLLNHANATPAYHGTSLSKRHIMVIMMLQSILRYAYATIDEIRPSAKECVR